MALGFTRLAINGNDIDGRQPHRYKHLVGAVNGEIYNFRELARSFDTNDSQGSDTRVVLPLFERSGPRVIEQLDGFYSGVVINRTTGSVFCLRDHIGKKPLFFGQSGENLFIASELKAFDRIDSFEIVPRGLTQVHLDSSRLELLTEHRAAKPSRELQPLMVDAVRKRLPIAKEPLGLFLSGGLDSSILAGLAGQLRNDIVYYALGDQDAPDSRAVETVAQALGLKDLRVVSPPKPSELSSLIRQVVYATESFNPSIISNGISTFLLARALRRDGIRVVLSGEGADELFGGYHLFQRDQQWRETRKRLIEDMHFTELRRLDMCTMAHGIEARCPFLDRTVRAFSDQLDFDDMFAENQNKLTLRHEFRELLPEATLRRPKTSFDVGSGVRGRVITYLRRNERSEREELKTIWEQLFTFDPSNSYFHRYPVLDHVIEKRGAKHKRTH